MVEPDRVILTAATTIKRPRLRQMARRNSQMTNDRLCIKAPWSARQFRPLMSLTSGAFITRNGHHWVCGGEYVCSHPGTKGISL